MTPAYRVAIVEDDESLRMALVGLLRSMGHDAIGYGSAERFLEHGDAKGVSCIITDIQLPGMSGIELIQRLRRDGRQVPAIAITARTEPGLAEKALAGGALCVLRKPFDTEVLVEKLEESLSSPGV